MFTSQSTNSGCRYGEYLCLYPLPSNRGYLWFLVSSKLCKWENMSLSYIEMESISFVEYWDVRFFYLGDGYCKTEIAVAKRKFAFLVFNGRISLYVFLEIVSWISFLWVLQVEAEWRKVGRRLSRGEKEEEVQKRQWRYKIRAARVFPFIFGLLNLINFLKYGSWFNNNFNSYS